MRHMQRKLRVFVVGLLAVAVGFAVLGTGSTAQAKGKAAKDHLVKGKIESIDGDTLTVTDKQSGTEKVHLANDTVYQMHTGKKKDGTNTAIARADLKPGEHVSISVKGDNATGRLGYLQGAHIVRGAAAWQSVLRNAEVHGDLAWPFGSTPFPMCRTKIRRR